MKKITVALCLLIAFIAQAQYVGSGFYRVHNVGTDCFITIRGTHFEKTTNPDAFWSCILMQKDPNQVSDVGSIIYIPGTEDASLYAQGVDTYSLTGLPLEIDTAKVRVDGKPTYLAKTWYRGFPSLFRDYGNGLTAGTLQNVTSYWWIEPVNEGSIDTSYVGLKPVNATIADANGYYWATMCCDFPFLIPEGSGVEGAYTVKELKQGDDGSYCAVAVKMCGQSEVVPAATPVLLKCKSNEVAGNKVVPVGEIANCTEMPIASDLLLGNYFSSFINHADLNDYTITAEYVPEQSSLASSDYLALTIDEEGKMCFLPQEEGTYMAANTAWLNIGDLDLEGVEKVYLAEEVIEPEDPEEPELILGDVNGDGELSIKDVTVLIEYLLTGESEAKNEETPSINFAGADVNGDGEISIKDVAVLINLILTGEVE